MKKLLAVLAILAALAVGGCVSQEDEGMIYVCDTNNGKVIILDSDLNFVDSFSAICYRIEVDANNIFLAQTGDIHKYLRASPYTEVDSVSTSSIGGMGSDDSNIYIGVSRDVKKYSKSTLTYVNEFATGHTFPIDGVAVDGTYIYTHDGGDLKKWRKSDYGLEWTVAIDGSYYPWLGLDEYGSYLFFTSGPGNGAALSINNKNDGSNYKRHEGLSTYGYYASGQVDYAYVVDYTSGVIRKVEISTGNIVASYSGMNNPRASAWYNLPPTAPTNLLCNGQTNPTGVT